MQYCTAILLAAGSGTRLDPNKTKQTHRVLGKSVLCRSAEALSRSSYVRALVVVVREDEMDFAREELKHLSLPFSLVSGGKTRQESAAIGFAHIPEQTTDVMIHDAARCLITSEGVDAVARAALESGAASAVSAVHDTVKLCDARGQIVSTVDRSSLCFAATPQAFSVSLYEKARQNAEKNQIEVTDDNMLIEQLGVPIVPVYLAENPKITTHEDLLYAEFLLKVREETDV